MIKRSFAVIVAVVISLTAAAERTELQGRGLVAVPRKTGGIFVSWRLMKDDPGNISFDLYRGTTCIKQDLYVTNYFDTYGSKTSQYKVVVKHAGVPVDTTEAVTPWADIYKRVSLQRPPSRVSYSYFPQESSIGDLNGDGKLELVIKWLPTNQQDNSISGVTGPAIFDAYTMDGEMLWRINLGMNIRSGSHYTQFMVYDFDGDGRAEMICKTAPGSKDGEGKYVSLAADDQTILATRNTADHRNSGGHILSGEEFLTVFDGTTGKAIHTVWYNPNRAFGVGGSASYSSEWGDSYGNRGERYLAGVAFLDGMDKNPSAVMCRGYYTRSYLWAVDFDGKKLSTKWLHGSVSKTKVEHTDSQGKKTSKTYSTNTFGERDSYTAYGQGNHQLAVCDADGDGKDEIIYGSATIDHDGQLLYTTGLGHGDAMHVGDLLPDHPGLEVFTVHEDTPYGWDVHDAATGKKLLYYQGSGDNGAGVAADIFPEYRGYEFWSVNGNSVYDTKGNVVNENRPAYRQRIYWDGDAQDELLDGVRLTKQYNQIMNFGNYGNSVQWGSKGYPVLLGDFLGDWREEVIYFDKSDSAAINIFSTTIDTKIAVPALMQDHTYRMALAWQNTAYNMPPHLGYFLADEVGASFPVLEGTKEQTITLGDSIVPVTCQMKNCTSAKLYYVYIDGVKRKSFASPDGMSFNINKTERTFTLDGAPQEKGKYEIIYRAVGDFGGNTVNDTITIYVNEKTTILKGDANNDGVVDVADITAIASYILGTSPTSWNIDNADANSDNVVDVADITATATIILEK